jgi:hypothetical protein
MNEDKITKYVNNWLELNERIKQENKIMTELYKNKQIIEQKINKYSPDTTTISLNNNIYKIYYTKTNKTISQKHIKQRINEYFIINNLRGLNKEDLYNFIISNREFNNKLNICIFNK